MSSFSPSIYSTAYELISIGYIFDGVCTCTVFGVQIRVVGSERVRKDHLAELHRGQTTSRRWGDTGEGS